MPRVEKLVAAAFVALGVPTAVAAVWQETLARRPGLAAVLALVYWALLGVFALVAKAASLPVNRRLDQLGEAVDRALGRRLSRVWPPVPGACRHVAAVD